MDATAPEKKTKAARAPRVQSRPPIKLDFGAGITPPTLILANASIPIDQIDLHEIDRSGISRKDEHEALVIEELARSMAAVGLLQPVELHLDKDRENPTHKQHATPYIRVFGRRRILAARRLGWTEIRAKVVRYAHYEDLISARAVENAQRLDLNPAQEAQTVAQHLELVADRMLMPKITGETGFENLPKERRSQVIDRVAQRLGKPATWVRDRAFIARLDGKAQQLVFEGRLPLPHAREICKVADPALRGELAVRCAGGTDQACEPPEDLEEVRRLVSAELLSLADVKWRLEVPFGGEPACDQCPHNSLNSPGLFEHHTSARRNRASYAGSCKSEGAAGVCTKASCYSRKGAAASQAIRSAAAKAQTAAAELPTNERPKAIGDLAREKAPAFVKPGLVVAKAVDMAKAPAQKKHDKIDDAQDRPLSDKELKEVAREAFSDAMQERAKKLEKPLRQALMANPGSRAAWKLFEDGRAIDACDHSFPDVDGKAWQAAHGAKLRALLKHVAAPSLEGMLALEGDIRRELHFNAWNYGDSGLFEVLAEVLGVKHNLGPTPTFADALVEAKAARDKKAPAKNGKAAKRTGAKGAA